MGYWVGRPYWNRGICSEALQAMIDRIRATTPIRSLISGHFVDNPASGRVMEKCGMVRRPGDSVPVSTENGLYNCRVYEMTRQQFELQGCSFGIYDKERLICDCLKYESKMSHDDFKTAIQAYIADPDKDISVLMDYARERKVLKKVQSLIGVWL